MRLTVPLRLAACLVLGTYSALAAAAVQIDFTGTTAHSTLVANGLPLSGSLSFDSSTAVIDYAYSVGTVSTVAYAMPGTAQFTVDGQTYNYNLSDILLDNTGIVLFILAETGDPSNSLFVIRQTSNTVLSAIPDVSTLDGFAFLSAQFPNGSTSVIGADLQLGSAAVPEPATWAMMLVGLGAIGTLLRRKQRVLPTH